MVPKQVEGGQRVPMSYEIVLGGRVCQCHMDLLWGQSVPMSYEAVGAGRVLFDFWKLG